MQIRAVPHPHSIRRAITSRIDTIEEVDDDLLIEIIAVRHPLAVDFAHGSWLLWRPARSNRAAQHVRRQFSVNEDITDID